MWLILLLANIHHILSFLLKWQSGGPNVMAELLHQPGKLKRNLRLLNMIGMHEMTLERWNEYGSSDALWSSKMSWCKDVAVDINMGCSKSFSISGGIGVALLTKPELIHDILTTLKMNLDTHVTCKIWLLNSSQDTVELAWRIEKTGVSALAVHGRYHLQKYLVVMWCIILTSVCLTSLALRVSPILHSWTKVGMKRAILWVPS